MKGPRDIRLGFLAPPTASTPLEDENGYQPLSLERRGDCDDSEVPSPRKLWSTALAPLLLHFIATIVIAFLISYIIDGHDFNLQSRRPEIMQPDNSTESTRSYMLLQSDITTFVSAALVVVRLFGGMWCGATVWRAIFILLEKQGITLHDINSMLSFGLPPMFHLRRYFQGAFQTPAARGTAIAIALILLLNFAYQFSSPLLTGSITWSPSIAHVSTRVPLSGITTPANGTAWHNYVYWDESWLAEEASGLASVAWGSLNYTSTQKRVIPAARHMQVNSTLDNVTMPYLSINSLDWISDPVGVFGEDELSKRLTGDSSPFSSVTTTVVAILQDSWKLSSKRPFPQPTQVSETRLMTFLYFHGNNLTGCRSPEFGDLPPEIGAYHWATGTDITCFLFANITYEAGAADCHNCNLASAGVVESDQSALQLKPDPMTFEALMLMPTTIISMALMNVSLPQPYNNINEYALAMLSRSYEACWTALTDAMISDSSQTFSTGVKISVLMSRAIVMQWRVYFWLSLNLLLTLSGIIFICIQVRCRRPLVVDASLGAFLLDTSHISSTGPRGLRDFSKLTKEDSEEVGFLHLRQRKEGHAVVILGNDSAK